MVPTSVRHAWRSLRRTPAFTLTASLTLVIGVGAAVAMFAVLNGVLLKPLPYGTPDRLVGIWHDLPPLSMTKANQTVGTYFTYRRLARTIDDVAVYQEGSVNVGDPTGVSAPQRITSAFVTASLLPTLQVQPMVGRNFSDAEDLPNAPLVVLISESLWRNRFGGDPAIIGKTLEVSGRPQQIIGVMPSSFRFPNAETQLWFPLALDPRGVNAGGFSYNGIARLKAGVTLQDVQRDFATVLPRIVDLFPTLAPGVPTQMLLDQAKPVPVITSMSEDVTGGIARTLWIVAGAAALVLLVACANVANLVLVRADARQRELAVREALGAGRMRVMAHFLGESAVLATIAAVGGLALAWAAIRALVASARTEIPRLAELHIDPATVAFTVVITIVVAAICSVIPALRIGRSRLSSALREGGRSGTSGKAQQRLRGTMVAVQIALALVVLAGSGLLLRTFRHLHAVRPGFDANDVATFWLSLPQTRYSNDSALVRFYGELSSRVSQLPGVKSAGVTSRIPLGPNGTNWNPFYLEGDVSSSTKIPPLQLYTTTDAGYFTAMSIPFLAGRNFERTGVQRDLEAIISQRTAEQFWKDPTGHAALGKRFRALPSGPWYTIIGVVGSVRDTALAAAPTSTVYFPQAAADDTLFTQAQRQMALIVKTDGEPTAVTTAVQRVMRELDPSLPLFDVRSMSAVMQASTAQLSFTIVILGAAAMITLLLGAIGLYGVMAYLVTLRTRELGVRIALGADPRGVAAMMTGQGLVLTAIGIGGGLLLFAGAARFLRSSLYGVSASDPLTLAAASLTLVAIATLASWIPARRAAMVDPASTLRAE